MASTVIPSLMLLNVPDMNQHGMVGADIVYGGAQYRVTYTKEGKYEFLKFCGELSFTFRFDGTEWEVNNPLIAISGYFSDCFLEELLHGLREANKVSTLCLN